MLNVLLICSQVLCLVGLYFAYRTIVHFKSSGLSAKHKPTELPQRFAADERRLSHTYLGYYN